MTDPVFRPLQSQHGLTIIEMMISITIGLLIMLILTQVVLSSKAGYTAQEQSVNIQETGRYALEIISRAIRQAGYEHLDGYASVSIAETSANVSGYDAMTLKKNAAALTSPSSTDVINGSDILALRFFGDDSNGEGSILNCAGLTVPAPASVDGAELDRGWSIFFVAKDSAGEPELRCKYQTKTGWNADAIARGVESFQVLYGVDLHGDGAPDSFVNADGIDALDGKLSLTGDNAVLRSVDLNRKTYWKKIRSVRFALLIRGSQKARDDALTTEHHLFGPDYSRLHAGDDKGVLIGEQTLPLATRDHIRKVFTQTIHLRNDAAGSSA